MLSGKMAKAWSLSRRRGSLGGDSSVCTFTQYAQVPTKNVSVPAGKMRGPSLLRAFATVPLAHHQFGNSSSSRHQLSLCRHAKHALRISFQPLPTICICTRRALGKTLRQIGNTRHRCPFADIGAIFFVLTDALNVVSKPNGEMVRAGFRTFFCEYGARNKVWWAARRLSYDRGVITMSDTLRSTGV